jgi:hypothetical protein
MTYTGRRFGRLCFPTVCCNEEDLSQLTLDRENLHDLLQGISNMKRARAVRASNKWHTGPSALQEAAYALQQGHAVFALIVEPLVVDITPRGWWAWSVLDPSRNTILAGVTPSVDEAERAAESAARGAVRASRMISDAR